MTATSDIVPFASGEEPEDRQAAFERRMARHGAKLKHSLEGVYGSGPAFETWFDRLRALLAATSEARPQALLRLDQARERDPNWFLRSDMIGYSAYVDRFAGTLTGLQDRVDYLRGLGVRYLHLLPFWKTRNGDSDGGFAVADYRAVRSDLGDIADLGPLTARLREAQISLCGDLVLNHTADDHPWAVAARQGDARYRGYFHILDDVAQVQAFEGSLDQVFPSTAPGNFTYCEALKGWVWTTFYPFQWDLNWSNPEVFAEMAAVILGLANQGVEAFRLDSAAYLWKRLGTVCRGEPEAHLILQALRAVVSIAAPGVLLKSEVIAPVADTAQFLGSAQVPECHVTYHSALMTAGWASLAEGDADIARAVIAQVPAIPAGAGFVTYVRCHDDIGWMTLTPQAGATPQVAEARLKRVADFYAGAGQGGFARGLSFQTADGVAVHGLNGMAASLTGLEAALTASDEAVALDRLILLYALAYAAGGVPIIYMGDELGQTNDYQFQGDPERAHEGRWLHRPMFDEAGAAQIHDLSTRAGRLFHRLLGLGRARRHLPAFGPESAPRLIDDLPAPVLGFRRGASHIALFNFADEAQSIVLRDLAETPWLDRLSGEATGNILVLPGFGSAWLEKVS